MEVAQRVVDQIVLPHVQNIKEDVADLDFDGDLVGVCFLPIERTLILEFEEDFLQSFDLFK